MRIKKGLITQELFKGLPPETKNHPYVAIAAINKGLIDKEAFDCLLQKTKNNPEVAMAAINKGLINTNHPSPNGRADSDDEIAVVYPSQGDDAPRRKMREGHFVWDSDSDDVQDER